MIGKKILVLCFMLFASNVFAEVFYYENFHPEFNSDLTIDQAESLEVQAMPTMTEYEKLGDFYYYNDTYKIFLKAHNFYKAAASDGSDYAMYITFLD